MKIEARFDSLRHFEEILKARVNGNSLPAAKMAEALGYCLFSGGKRLRPMLVYWTGALFDLPLTVLDPMAFAIECIHTYSLIHDDLPAMDDDDFRRGRPSCHRAFDEASAILLGDGLQAMGYEVLLAELPPVLGAEKSVAICLELLRAAGLSGMVGGQSLDLSELASSQLSEARLAEIHQLKTGCLIKAAVKMVLLAAEPASVYQQALLEFAAEFGLVFQMQDDYLDAYAAESLGKAKSSDQSKGKKTYANFYSQSALRDLIEAHYLHMKNALSVFGDKAQPLLLLIDELTQRSS